MKNYGNLLTVLDWLKSLIFAVTENHTFFLTNEHIFLYFWYYHLNTWNTYYFSNIIMILN